MTKFVDLSALVAASVVSSPAAKPATTVRSVATAPSAVAATIFLAALRAAGKRPNAVGVLVPSRNPDYVKADEQEAVRQFTGYSIGEPHGSQLDKARALAQRTLQRAQPAFTPYRRGSEATVAGYVAGMPDPVARANAELEAPLREAIAGAADAMSRQDWVSLQRFEAIISDLRAKQV